jgi:hypothetical protein
VATGSWGGRGPMPGLPLFVMTHRVPDAVPTGDPPYTFVTDGIGSAVEKARAAAADKNVVLMGANVVAVHQGRPARRTRHQPGPCGAGSRSPPAGRSGPRQRRARPRPSRRRPRRHAPDLPRREIGPVLRLERLAMRSRLATNGGARARTRRACPYHARLSHRRGARGGRCCCLGAGLAAQDVASR